MLIAFLFAPVILFLLLAAITKRAPLFWAIVCAGVSLGFFLFGVLDSRVWPEGHRLAWLGLGASKGGGISIGGTREKAVCGWPSGDFSPAVTFMPDGEAAAKLTISGGGGFLINKTSGEILNGTTVNIGSSLEVHEYTLQFVKGGSWLPGARRLRLLQGHGTSAKLLVSLDLEREPLWGGTVTEGKARSLGGMVESGKRADNVTASDLVLAREALGDVRIFIPKVGSLRVLNDKQSDTARVVLPCALELRFPPNRRLPAKLESRSGQLHLIFDRPSRATSPMPPDSSKPIIFALQARPAEQIFPMPFGGRCSEERPSLRFKAGPSPLLLDMREEGVGTLVPEEFVSRAPKDWPMVENEVSGKVLRIAEHEFHVGMIYDLPSKRLLVVNSLLAFLLFSLGALVSTPRMGIVEPTRWAVFGVSLTLWAFLMLRLLLSLRYALEPAYLDTQAVRGVVNSFAALAIGPGLLLLVLRRSFLNAERGYSKDAERRWWMAAGVFLLGAFASWMIARRLWHGWEVDWWKPVISLSAYAVITAILCRTAKNLQPRLYSVWSAVFRGRWHGHDRWRLVMNIVVICLIAAGLVLATGVVSHEAVKFSTEVVCQLLLIWLPVFCLLCAKGETCTGNYDLRRWRWSSAASCAVVLVLMPIVLQPLITHDKGSVCAAFAVFIPLGLLLLATPSRMLGTVVLLGVTVAIILASAILYLKPELAGEAGIRVRSWLKNDDMELDILFSEGISSSDDVGAKAWKVQNVIQHSWENRAIAHTGGIVGEGFGQAPVRNSQVPQQTVQCDSVFSFFILGDHGLVGGATLLVAGLLPLCFFFASGRQKLDPGVGLAVLIGAAFAFEVALQGAMNLGLLPFTGRNIPLLTVNSNTDLVRWLILMSFGTHALFYRFNEHGGLVRETASILSKPPEYGTTPAPERLAGPFIFTAAVPALLAVGTLGYAAWRVNDEKYGMPITKLRLEEQVQAIARSGLVEVDQKTLELHPGPALKTRESMLLPQEITRFNALPVEDRKRERIFAQLGTQLATVRTLDDFASLLRDLLEIHRPIGGSRRPSPFALEKVPEQKDEDGESIESDAETDDVNGQPKPGEYHLIANPAYINQIHFHHRFTPEELPHLKWANELLIGPAWFGGRTVLAADDRAPIPWLGPLADALAAEWSRLGGRDGAKRYKGLTLDRDLQKATMGFASDKAIALHEEVIREANQRVTSDKREAAERMPPRVAVCVMDISDGAEGHMLAMGGWPRMTSAPFSKEQNGQIILSRDWLDQSASLPIRTHYGGDRNFDRLLMGSTTKPLWAAVVLSLNQKLARQLYVRGGDAREHEVFGIPICPENKSWHVLPSLNWRGFDEYLAVSDNRYHVRLGFFGLSAMANGAFTSASKATLAKESLLENPAKPIAPMGFVPKFDERIVFGKEKPKILINLNTTPLAEAWRQHFTVGIDGKQLNAHRLSFWTGDENDDLFSVILARQNHSGSAPSAILDNISPETVQLDLHKVKTPRQYVSLLFGGGSNLWSNVDLAGAFGSVVVGKAIVPHVIETSRPVVALVMPFDPKVRDALRPGLAWVLQNRKRVAGTAYSHLGREAHDVLDRMGVTAYAKTGTLREEDAGRNTSRIVIALIQESSDKRRGLVISIAAERGGTHRATEWLGQYLVKNVAFFQKFFQR
jgi:hypothetical protein